MSLSILEPVGSAPFWHTMPISDLDCCRTRRYTVCLPVRYDSNSLIQLLSSLDCWLRVSALTYHTALEVINANRRTNAIVFMDLTSNCPYSGCTVKRWFPVTSQSSACCKPVRLPERLTSDYLWSKAQTYAY